MHKLGNNPLKTPKLLIETIKELDAENGSKLAEVLSGFRPKLIINMARTDTDKDLGFGVRSIFRKYWGIELDYMGALEYDDYVWQSVRKRRPIMLDTPNSNLSLHIDRIAKALVNG
jgi:flagellar biosynthesis protein FlhG